MPMDKHSDGADIMDCTHPVLTGNMCVSVAKFYLKGSVHQELTYRKTN
jgi:hypothetical protein